MVLSLLTLVVGRKRLMVVEVLRIVGLGVTILLAEKAVHVSANHGGRGVVDQGTTKYVYKPHLCQAPKNAARRSRIVQL